ncbi:MAG: hypothetical protein WCD80_02285 [Desulfobaccales bacterium]
MSNQTILPQDPETFLLGWGPRDIKRRYDKVPELEMLLARVKDQMNEIGC